MSIHIKDSFYLIYEYYNCFKCRQQLSLITSENLNSNKFLSVLHEKVKCQQNKIIQLINSLKYLIKYFEWDRVQIVVKSKLTVCLSENYSKQIYGEYFGPEYAPKYQIKTNINQPIETITKESQTVSTPNHTDQQLPLNSIQQNEKYLTNTNYIFDSFLDLDSHKVNSSYENSIHDNKSILKKKEQKTSNNSKSVKFTNTDSKIKLSIVQHKQLGLLLKRRHQ